jgi:hypothetical protein
VIDGSQVMRKTGSAVSSTAAGLALAAMALMGRMAQGLA